MPSPPPSWLYPLAHAVMEDLGRALLGTSLQARGWTFGLDRARTRLGACHPAQKRITVSGLLAGRLGRAEVEDTVRHEVAHAIDVERRGFTCHDATWKALARQCGARPARTYAGSRPPDPSAPYGAECPTCGRTRDLYREPVHAPRCGPCERASAPAYLRVVHRSTGRVIWTGGASVGVAGGRAGLEATCPVCGATIRRARRPAVPTACLACCRREAGGRYDARFRLTFVRRRGGEG